MKISFLKIHFLIALVLPLLLSSCDNNGAKTTISGAGATFPLPYYNLAFKTYMGSSNITVNYGGIGSGGGIRSLKDRVVDFSGSDAFLTDEELKSMPAELIHIPTCMGAVVLAYNLPKIPNLNLNSSVLSKIYRGYINNWSNKEIQELNPGVILPDLEIFPVYRSDGSGTNFVFSYYLNETDSLWAKSLSYGKSLNYPVGIAAKGNPGVAGIISQTTGAIGYISSEFALAMSLKTADIQNASGSFISPSIESISAAADGVLPSDTRAMITNSSVKEAYPISCLTWLLVYKEQNYSNRSKESAQQLQKLLKWMLSEQAQALCPKVHYAPLPISLRNNAIELINGITHNSKPVSE